MAIKSDYERARVWLERNPVTREQFTKLFPLQLDNVKGDQWEREGLFVTPRQEFLKQAREEVRNEAKARVIYRSRRRSYFEDKRGRRHIRDNKTGRFVKGRWIAGRYLA